MFPTSIEVMIEVITAVNYGWIYDNGITTKHKFVGFVTPYYSIKMIKMYIYGKN